MKTYNVELKRTSYITVTVEAGNQDAAEDIAWLELGRHEHKDGYGDWDLESIEEIPNEQ
jgi:hypothetical protein